MKDLNERGLENQVKGTAKEVKGQVRGDVGDATDNTSEGRSVTHSRPEPATSASPSRLVRP